MKIAPSLFVLFLLSFLELKAVDIPETASILPGYDKYSVNSHFDNRPLSNEEGVWFSVEDGLKVAIENTEPENKLNPLFQIVAIESDDTSLDCGQILGYLQTSENHWILRMWAYSEMEGNVWKKPVECVAELDESNHYMLVNKPKIKFRFAINLLRLFPSFIDGLNIYPYLDKKRIKPGFKRIYPTPKSNEIIYF